MPVTDEQFLALRQRVNQLEAKADRHHDRIMKIIITLLAAFMCSSAFADSHSTTFSWGEAIQDGPDLTTQGYIVYKRACDEPLSKGLIIASEVEDPDWLSYEHEGSPRGAWYVVAVVESASAESVVLSPPSPSACITLEVALNEPAEEPAVGGCGGGCHGIE